MIGEINEMAESTMPVSPPKPPKFDLLSHGQTSKSTCCQVRINGEWLSFPLIEETSTARSKPNLVELFSPTLGKVDADRVAHL